MIGLGFGLNEAWYDAVHSDMGIPIIDIVASRFLPIVFHMMSAGLMGLFILKKKWWLGYLIVVALHNSYNFLIDYNIYSGPEIIVTIEGIILGLGYYWHRIKQPRKAFAE